MLIRQYKDFDDLFMGLVREVLTNPHILDYTNGINGFLENVYFHCDSYKCKLNLGAFGYRENKWRSLIGTYVGLEELQTYKEKLRTNRGLSLTFYFNRKKMHNGSCLIAIVLTRNNRNKPWQKVNVLYRTTEIQRRFAADLVLINRFISELPKDICKIEEVTFYFPIAYISALYINGYYDMFGIPMEDLDDTHPWIRSLIKKYERWFKDPNTPDSPYKAMARMTKMHKGETTYEPLYAKDLTLEKTLMKMRGKK